MDRAKLDDVTIHRQYWYGMCCHGTSDFDIADGKLEILRQPIGQRIMRYASLDDIAIWGVLALILLDWTRVGRQLGFFVVFAVATYLYRKAMIRLQEPDRWYVALIWLAVCGMAADWAGLHFMVGSFLAGAVMDADWFNQEKMNCFAITFC